VHQDLEDTGFRVNYRTGKMHDPGGHVLTMVKSGAVWQIPVILPPKHIVLAATTTTPATTTSVSTTMQDVECMHEVLCFAGTTTMRLYYKYYHGTGLGKESTAEVRNFRCPIKTMMQVDANPKRRCPTDTTDVHAAHLDDEGCVCACCADQQSKCVQFTSTGPWTTLHGSASEPTEC
jgi:hypothetical protein